MASMSQPIPGDRAPSRPPADQTNAPTALGGGARGGQPILARPPSDRYRRPVAAAPTSRDAARAVALAIAIAVAGAAVFVLLAGLLAIDIGLLGVAALLGYLIGLATRGTAPVLGRGARFGLAVAIVVVGLFAGDLGTWLVALRQGGVLSFTDHMATVYGWQVPATYVLGIVAAGVGAW